jgi:hypothetical protein
LNLGRALSWLAHLVHGLPFLDTGCHWPLKASRLKATCLLELAVEDELIEIIELAPLLVFDIAHSSLPDFEPEVKGLEDKDTHSPPR